MTVDETRRHPCSGERNRSAKLTEEQAREIKRSREPLLVLAARDDKNSPCKGPVRVALRDTDAARAVCEWRGSKDGQLAYMGCTKRLEWTYDRRKCPSCGKSIKFTEAK